MKFYDKKRKSRVDLYDIEKNLDCIHTLAIFPFPEEFSLTCPVQGRPETVTYLAMTSWGDLCHINIQLRPHEKNLHLMKAKIELYLRLSNSETGILYACEEDILDLNKLKDYQGNVLKYKIGGFLLENKRPFANTRIVFKGFFKLNRE